MPSLTTRASGCGRLGEKSVINSTTWSGVAVVTKSNSNLVRTGRTYQRRACGCQPADMMTADPPFLPPFSLLHYAACLRSCRLRDDQHHAHPISPPRLEHLGVRARGCCCDSRSDPLAGSAATAPQPVDAAARLQQCLKTLTSPVRSPGMGIAFLLFLPMARHGQGGPRR